MVVFKTKNSLLHGIFQISRPHATSAKTLEIKSSNDVISQLGIGGDRGRANGRRHGDPQVKLDLWMVSDLRCLFLRPKRALRHNVNRDFSRNTCRITVHRLLAN